MLQILDVSLQRKINKGHATLLPKQQYVHVILAQRVRQKFLCAKKKNVQLTPCRRENRRSCEAPQYSAVDFSVIFALLGEQSRVPTFRHSETPWAASQAVDEGATHQESVPLLRSSSPGFVPEL